LGTVVAHAVVHGLRKRCMSLRGEEEEGDCGAGWNGKLMMLVRVTVGGAGMGGDDVSKVSFLQNGHGT
jgi:hypothetical protein